MSLFSPVRFGALVAAVGAAHFVAPSLFEGATRLAFPQDTAEWVLRDGALETALGLAIVLKPTRAVGVLGLLGYGGWLGYNGARTAGVLG